MLRQRRPQVVDRADAELAPQPPQRLRPDAGETQERHDRARVLLAQRLELRDAPRLEELADGGCGALPDALDLLELGDREPAEVGRLGGDGLRRALVSAHAEGLRVGLLEQRELRELAQHVEHVLLRVRHPSWCSLAAVAKEEAPEVLALGGREVRITHP